KSGLFYHLLPFVEEDQLYKTFKPNAKVAVYLSPEDPTLDDKAAGPCSFAANLRLFTTRGLETKYDKDIEPFKKPEDCAGKTRIPKEVPDGLSNTLMFATKLAVCGEGGCKWASSPLDKTAPFFGQNAATEKAGPDSAKATYQLAPGKKECRFSPL